MISKSKAENAFSVVISFYPHPYKILRPHECSLINTYEEKEEMLEELGIDYLVEIEFDRDFSNLESHVFLEKYVFINHQIKGLYLGHDFAFGPNKSGTNQLIEKYCDDRNIFFEVQQKYSVSEMNVSSTLIRQKIIDGEVDVAGSLLERNFFIAGLVKKGDGRGKKIGVPTANLEFDHDKIAPKNGVYATKTTLGTRTFYSVTNVGYNPTFNDSQLIHIETHIFDFDEDIYGEKLKIEFCKRIRGEIKFSSIDSLVLQIKNDIQSAKEFLSHD